MDSGAEDTKLISVVDDPTYLAHHQRAKTATLAVWGGRDSLDITRSQRLLADVDRALHDRGMCHDPTIVIEEDVRTTDGMLPVVFLEALVCRGERAPEEVTERRDLRG